METQEPRVHGEGVVLVVQMNRLATEESPWYRRGRTSSLERGCCSGVQCSG